MTRSVLLMMTMVAGVLSSLSSAGAAQRLAETPVSVVSVRAVVEIGETKSDITLADLIASPTMSRTAQERMKSVRLADAPRAGESRSFSDMGLTEIFRPELAAIQKETGETFQLRIPSHVTVTKKRFRLDAVAVEAALQERFRTMCSECEFEISGLNVPSVASAMSANTQWKIITRSEIPRGSFSLPIEVTQTSGATRSYWVTGTLAVRRPVSVAARAIALGERIQVEDLVTQKKDVTFSSDVPVTPADLLSGVAARSISAGQIVWRGSLRRELAVKYGDLIKVSAGGESWQLTIDGVAQNSGYLGDAVRVKIPRTQKIVSGLLRANGVVEVQ